MLKSIHSALGGNPGGRHGRDKQSERRYRGRGPVAALNDMAASTPGLTGRTLKKLDGVGEAALFSAEPVGGTQ